MRRPLLVLALALCGCPAPEPGVEAPAERGGEVLAWLDGEPVRLEDVGPSAAFRIWRREMDIYSILRSETEELVDGILVAREAERRGTTPEALLEEVAAGAPPASEADVDRYLAQNPQARAADAERVRERVRHFLSEERRIERRLAFLDTLRRDSGYRFVLEPPAQPRTRVDVAGAPARGPADAPVTIVHFATFTSRASASSAERIAALRAAHPGKIRQVHRSFLNDRDENGLLAARVALLAADAGRFWELHDALFARGGRVDENAISECLREAGLDGELLERARRDASLLERVRSEVTAGVAAGAPREPTLFVNGRYVSGLVPLEELREIVAGELSGLTKSRSASQSGANRSGAPVGARNQGET